MHNRLLDEAGRFDLPSYQMALARMETPGNLTDADLDQLGYVSKYLSVHASQARLLALLNRSSTMRRKATTTAKAEPASRPTKSRRHASPEDRASEVVGAVRAALRSDNPDVRLLAETVLALVRRECASR